MVGAGPRRTKKKGGRDRRAPARTAQRTAPAPPTPDDFDRPRLDPLAHRGTEKARFFRQSMREVEERRRTGIYPPHIRPVAANGGAS